MRHRCANLAGMPASRRIVFGTYELDLETSELWKNGRHIKLSPKPAKVLAVLASAPGELVTRDALRAELWGTGTFVDFELSLNFCIRQIRLALKDNVRKPKYIETLPRRGYRFIASIDAPPCARPVTVPPDAEASQIRANEHYSRARVALAQHGKTSLDEAYEEFQRALALKPDYAMAHSGLGATISLRMLNRRGHGELSAALHHLRRALELDPELSEPFAWLCFVHIRRGETALARHAGQRGVELQPDLPQAHYFLALAYFASCEEGTDYYQEVADQLAEAARVGPRWHATWFVLAYTAMLVGDYRRAETFAQRLLATYNQPGMPFVGGEIVIGSVLLRQGDAPGARRVLEDFLDRMAGSDHMYRDAMLAVAACVLGDLELRQERNDLALVAYRRAWQTAQEHTRIVAHQRIGARAQAGLAAAYWLAGQRERSRDLLHKAAEMAISAAPVSMASAAASLPELYLGVAAAYSLAGQKQPGLDMVSRAVASGWRDAAWLREDSLLCALRNEPEFLTAIEKIRHAPSLRWARTETRK